MSVLSQFLSGSAFGVPGHIIIGGAGGGGGGGNVRPAGGGGGGTVSYGTFPLATNYTYNVIIAAGGAGGATGAQGSTASTTIFGPISTYGGGGGGAGSNAGPTTVNNATLCFGNTGAPGVPNGTGSSTGQPLLNYFYYPSGLIAGNGSPHNPYGIFFSYGGNYGGSVTNATWGAPGGAGAGGAGNGQVGNASGANGGSSSNGFDIYGTGTYINLALGGGGGGGATAGGTGGVTQGTAFGTGGGTGQSPTTVGSAGAANRGTGGGGGASTTNTVGLNGGSGVVIIAYPDAFPAAIVTGSPELDTTSRPGYRIYRFTGSGSFMIAV
jgi:hypothetical protein